ncbi:unnamed protein product [Aspergillus oryzae]|nr:unnamed protein product [Aspergillus oryzae]
MTKDTHSPRLVESTKFDSATDPMERPPRNDVTDKEQWAARVIQRAVSVAKRAGGDDDLDQEPASPIRNATRQSSGNLASQPAQLDLPPGTTAKMMDLQYFLELVDLKHRHGSNLRVYHSYWKNSTTAQNFFFWLDYGEGEDLDLPQCPRDKLERQQVRYLSREERMNYLVRVDEAGLFRWAKNNERVWTDNRRFKDSLKGVVHIDEDAPQFQGNTEAGDPDSFLTSSSSSVSSLSSSDYDSDSDMCVREAKETYVNEDYKAVKKLKKVVHVSPSTVLSSIRGKSLKKEDMWIFVSFSISCIYYILTLACSGCRYLLSLGYTRTKHKVRALHEKVDDVKQKVLQGHHNGEKDQDHARCQNNDHSKPRPLVADKRDKIEKGHLGLPLRTKPANEVE